MKTLRWLEAAGIACIAVSVACTLHQDGNPFGSGSGGYPVTTAAPVEGDTGDDESTSSDEDEGDADDGHGDSSSDGGVDPSTTMPPTTDPTSDPTMDPDPTGVSTDGGDPTGAMPGAGGLYDHCLAPEDCGPGTTACLQIVDMMNMPIAGFCTHEGCSDAASDCAAATSGNAQPFCLPVMVNNMADAVCALDCGGGETCPDGTTCIQLEVGWVCA